MKYINKQTLIAAAIGTVLGGVLAYKVGAFDKFVGTLASKLPGGGTAAS